jgi:hypothetical protein
VNDDCLKLTTYFGERNRVNGDFLADALIDIYGRHELQTSLMMRGTEGFDSSSTGAQTCCSACPRTCLWSAWLSTPAPASRPRWPTSTRCAFKAC